MAVSLMLCMLVVTVGVIQATGGAIHCVKPSNSLTSIDCGNGQNLCEELHFYVSNASLYFSSNTTLEFLPGDHFLNNTNVSISDTKMNLKLTGENVACFSNRPLQSQPQIICFGQAGFLFQGVENLTLSKLSFTHCGQFVPATLYGHDDGVPKASLAFDTVTNLTLQSLEVCNGSGYGLLLYNTRKHLIVRNCDLSYNRGNASYLGGNTLVNYIGTGCFANNSDGWPGAEVEITNSTFSFGNYEFEYNDTGTLATGLAITLSCTKVIISIKNITARGNRNSIENEKGFGGNVFIHFFNTKHLISNTVSISNSRFLDGRSWLGAGLGISLYIGAIQQQTVHNSDKPYQARCENKIIIKNSVFRTNEAYTGSALYVNCIEHLLHNNCTANITLKNCTLSKNSLHIRKNAKLIGNTGVITFLAEKLSGVSITNLDTYNVLIDGVTLEYSELDIQDYRRIVWGRAALYVKRFLDSFRIRNCTFQHNNMSAIFAFHSYITLNGNTILYNNTGANGGGVLLCASSNIIITPNTTLTVVKNHALHSGGGIYVEDSCTGSNPLCFYQIEGVHNCGDYKNLTQLAINCHINITMINNTADYAGSQIYGGSIGNCYIHQLSFIPGYSTFKNIFHQVGPSTDLSSITSDPKMTCFCKNLTTVNCTEEVRMYPQVVYPGESVTLLVVIVGQLSGTVPGQLQVNTSDTQYISFNTQTTCTNITFTAHHKGELEAIYEIEVFSRLGNNTSFALSKSKYLNVHFKSCPRGYELNETGTCDCSSLKNIKCDFTHLKLTRSPPAWLGVIDGNLVYQSICPYDYCTDQPNVSLEIKKSIFDPDAQCSPNRTGILCGACKENFSLSGSSSACIDCTWHPIMYLSWYIIGQLLYGVALIVLITLTNWTITDGTLSGLLFYANIFKLNMFLFLPHRFNGITVIILALNMDFHSSRCLYNGFDAYKKAWLTFMFPVYLWILIAAVIYLSRCFDCMAKLFGGNGVKILATLIELSYAGLTQAVIIALSPVQVDVVTPYPNETSSSLRWVYDANIVYLRSKHIFLFLAGVVFGLLIIVYTLILLFIQPLQCYSNLRFLSWVAKLKPLTDAYTCPHIIKKNCQFWPGLLLSVRLVLIVVFTFNVKMERSTNLVAIMSGCLLLSTVAWSMGGIYIKPYLNVLNSFFILNLALLALLVNSYERMHINFAYISASLSILIMFSILLCLVILRLKNWFRRCWRVRLRWGRRFNFLRDVTESQMSGLADESSLLS